MRLWLAALACLFLFTTGAAPPSPTAARVLAILDSTGGSGTLWAVYVADARTGDVLLARNEAMGMLPASNAKTFTMATALDVFGSAKRFRTPLLFKGTQAGGVLRGDLVVRGSGDPSFGSSEMAGPDPFDTWAQALRARGVTRIEGRLVGDDDAFDDHPYGEGWDIDYVTKQASRLLGVSASGLSYHDNLVTVRLGTTARNAAGLATEPAGYLDVVDRSSTEGRTRGSAVRMRRVLGTERIVLGGSIPRSTGATLEIPVTNPTALAAHAFRSALDSAGIDVRALKPFDVDDLPEPPDPEGADTLAVHVSPPLGEILQVVGHESNNFYADQIFRAFGWAGTAEGAGKQVQAFLAKAGARAELNSLFDGSGLSRKNYVTAEALGRTYVTMYSHRERQAFFDALAGPGIESTLQYRLPGLRVRAKTGSLEFVRALSGYVTTESGQDIVFVLLANNFAGAPYRVVATMDRVVNALATGGL